MNMTEIDYYSATTKKERTKEKTYVYHPYPMNFEKEELSVVLYRTR